MKNRDELEKTLERVIPRMARIAQWFAIIYNAGATALLLWWGYPWWAFGTLMTMLFCIRFGGVRKRNGR